MIAYFGFGIIFVIAVYSATFKGKSFSWKFSNLSRLSANMNKNTEILSPWMSNRRHPHLTSGSTVFTNVIDAKKKPRQVNIFDSQKFSAFTPGEGGLYEYKK